VEVDGTIVRNVTVPNTGSLGTFTPRLTQFGLTAGGLPEQGPHMIRLLFHGDGQVLDKVVLWGRRAAMYADGYAHPRFSANRTNGTAPLTVQFTDQSSQWTYGWHWYFGDYSTSAYSTVQHPVHTFQSPGIYTVSLSINEGSYWFKVGDGMFGWFNHFWDSQHPYGSETTTMQVTVDPPVTAIPPSSTAPLDGDGDGRYEDLNGNGRRDFEDLVLLFNRMDWITANEPIAAFDYNGNGRIDFADVLWLFTTLDTAAARTFTVTAVAMGPGRIVPSGTIAVPEGGNVTFTLTSESALPGPHDTQSGYLVGNHVIVDPTVTPTPYPAGQYGPPGGGVRSYTLTNVQSDHTVYGVFYYFMMIA
jgi:hypothetical protein